LAVHFHEHEISAGIRNKTLLKKWLHHVIQKEEASVGIINVIFTSDEKLEALNKEYLSRNNLTDVIAFDYSKDQMISGDVFISIPRVKENAEIFSVSFKQELKRVIIHGILHMLGYDDKDAQKAEKMRKMEDLYLLESPLI
jgi:rRNA maturation RNase YbeY